MLGLTPQMVVVLDVMRLVAVGDDVEIGEVAIEVDAASATEIWKKGLSAI